MDETNYSTEHRKGQHLLSEEQHEIEVRIKDGWSIYKISKHLGRPYNTIKNEIQRRTELKSNGNPKRYKADSSKKAYLENRKNCRRVYRFLQVSRFLVYVASKVFGDEKWSLDAAFGAALRSGEFRRDEMVCTKTLYNYVDLGLLSIKNIDLPEKLRRNTKAKKRVKTSGILAQVLMNTRKSWIYAQNSVIRKRIPLSAKRMKVSLVF